jgi:hypothetical protein
MPHVKNGCKLHLDLCKLTSLLINFWAHCIPTSRFPHLFMWELKTTPYVCLLLQNKKSVKFLTLNTNWQTLGCVNKWSILFLTHVMVVLIFVSSCLCFVGICWSSFLHSHLCFIGVHSCFLLFTLHFLIPSCLLMLYKCSSLPPPNHVLLLFAPTSPYSFLHF